MQRPARERDGSPPLPRAYSSPPRAAPRIPAATYAASALEGEDLDDDSDAVATSPMSDGSDRDLLTSISSPGATAGDNDSERSGPEEEIEVTDDAQQLAARLPTFLRDKFAATVPVSTLPQQQQLTTDTLRKSTRSRNDEVASEASAGEEDDVFASAVSLSFGAHGVVATSVQATGTGTALSRRRSEPNHGMGARRLSLTHQYPPPPTISSVTSNSVTGLASPRAPVSRRPSLGSMNPPGSPSPLRQAVSSQILSAASHTSRMSIHPVGLSMGSVLGKAASATHLGAHGPASSRNLALPSSPIDPAAPLPRNVTNAIRNITLVRRTLPRNGTLPRGSLGDTTPAADPAAPPPPQPVDIDVTNDQPPSDEDDVFESMALLHVDHTRAAQPPRFLVKLLQLLGPAGYRAQAWLNELFHNPFAPAWKSWDRLTWAMDIYYVLVIPPTLAFMCDFTSGYMFSYLFFDTLSLMRVILNTLRPKVNKFGQLITDAKGKRDFYFKNGAGWCELIGAIPIDWIPLFVGLPGNLLHVSMACQNPYYLYADGSMTQGVVDASKSLVDRRFVYHLDNIPPDLLLYSILRVLRLVSTVGTVKWALQAKIPWLSSPISRLIKNLIMSLFLTHIDSCVFFFLETMVMSEKRWINEIGASVDKFGVPQTVWVRYLINYFYCQRSLFFIPRETMHVPAEIIYQCCEALFAACLYGSILGNLSQIVRSFDSQATLDKAERHRKVTKRFLSKYMIAKEFPVPLQEKVLNHEEFEWVHKRGMDTERIFHAFPKSLRLEVCVHLYYALICEVPLFKDTDDVFKVALCEKISLISAQKGFYVAKAGDVGNEMYFIRAGAVNVLTKDESKIIVTLGQGAFFGEISIFQECRRTATVRTACDTELCVLKKSDFDEILQAYPSMVAVFRQAVAEREERDAARRRDEEASAALKAKEAEIARLEQQDRMLQQLRAKGSSSTGSSAIAAGRNTTGGSTMASGSLWKVGIARATGGGGKPGRWTASQLASRFGSAGGLGGSLVNHGELGAVTSRSREIGSDEGGGGTGSDRSGHGGPRGDTHHAPPVQVRGEDMEPIIESASTTAGRPA